MLPDGLLVLRWFVHEDQAHERLLAADGTYVPSSVGCKQTETRVLVVRQAEVPEGQYAGSACRVQWAEAAVLEVRGGTARFAFAALADTEHAAVVPEAAPPVVLSHCPDCCRLEEGRSTFAVEAVAAEASVAGIQAPVSSGPEVGRGRRVGSLVESTWVESVWFQGLEEASTAGRRLSRLL